MMVATIAEEGSQPASRPWASSPSADPGTFSVTGQIAATYKRGFLINDGTGSILIYTNADPTGTYAIGDLVSVEGTTSAYAGLNQYPPHRPSPNSIPRPISSPTPRSAKWTVPTWTVT